MLACMLVSQRVRGVQRVFDKLPPVSIHPPRLLLCAACKGIGGTEVMEGRAATLKWPLLPQLASALVTGFWAATSNCAAWSSRYVQFLQVTTQCTQPDSPPPAKASASAGSIGQTASCMHTYICRKLPVPSPSPFPFAPLQLYDLDLEVKYLRRQLSHAQSMAELRERNHESVEFTISTLREQGDLEKSARTRVQVALAEKVSDLQICQAATETLAKEITTCSRGQLELQRRLRGL